MEQAKPTTEMLKSAYDYLTVSKNDFIKSTLERSRVSASGSEKLTGQIKDYFLSFRQQMAEVQQNLNNAIYNIDLRDQLMAYEKAIRTTIDAFVNQQYFRELISKAASKMPELIQMLRENLEGGLALLFDILQVLDKHKSVNSDLS